MKLEVIGKSVVVTPAMKSQAEKKLRRIESLFEPGADLRGTVIYAVHPTSQACEVSVSSPKIALRAKSTGQDAYECLDLCIDKLEGQMRKVKTQVERSRNNKSIAKNIGLELAKADEIEASSPENIVKRKKLDLVPMDVDEAVARMDALGHSFFIYLDSKTGLVNVLYQRDDGGFGVIEVTK